MERLIAEIWRREGGGHLVDLTSFAMGSRDEGGPMMLIGRSRGHVTDVSDRCLAKQLAQATNNRPQGAGPPAARPGQLARSGRATRAGSDHRRRTARRRWRRPRFSLRPSRPPPTRRRLRRESGGPRRRRAPRRPRPKTGQPGCTVAIISEMRQNAAVAAAAPTPQIFPPRRVGDDNAAG